MAGTSPNAILEIIKGIAIVPQDTRSSEVGLDSIDLLDPKGFSCDVYEIQLPNMKGSAVWADSPITDGRTLISGALGNVKETIRLNVTAGTLVQLAALLSKLVKFKQDCNDFWDTFVQIEPVYLKHQIEGEPGPRYALLYDIDINVEQPINPGDPKRMVTLAIEREYGWRGIAPGDNPKHWSYIANNQAQQWNANNTHLFSGVDHLVHSSTIENRAVLATGTASYMLQNFIDVPAASIPGDLPALLSISVGPTGGSTAPTALIIGKSTKKTTGNLSRTSGANSTLILTLNSSDSAVATDTTLAADTGASSPIGGGSGQRTVTTFVTASMVTRTAWSGTQYTTGLNASVLRGRYAVFLRARVSAAATCDIQVEVTQGGQGVTTTPVTFSDLGAGGTGNTTDWGFLYLGQVNIPTNNRVDISPNGEGIYNDSGGASLTINLQASRTSGAGSLYTNDLLFLPIDEGVVNIVSPILVNTARGWNYDNTGYYLHGSTGDMANIVSGTGATAAAAEADNFSGAGIMLTPKTQNRLMMIAYVDSTKRSFIDDPQRFTVRINIVPRWSGLRDT